MSDLGSKAGKGIHGYQVADLAAESTSALPRMPLWLGTRTKFTLWIEE